NASIMPITSIPMNTLTYHSTVLTRVHGNTHTCTLTQTQTHRHCYDPGGSRPRPVIFACLFSLSLQQAIGDRCILDWMGYKSPDQPADGRALVFPSVGYRWSWNRAWIVNCRWILDFGFWIVVVIVVVVCFILPLN